jgi:hypothetical protein
MPLSAANIARLEHVLAPLNPTTSAADQDVPMGSCGFGRQRRAHGTAWRGQGGRAGAGATGIAHPPGAARQRAPLTPGKLGHNNETSRKPTMQRDVSAEERDAPHASTEDP